MCCFSPTGAAVCGCSMRVCGCAGTWCAGGQTHSFRGLYASRECLQHNSLPHRYTSLAISAWPECSEYTHSFPDITTIDFSHVSWC